MPSQVADTFKREAVIAILSRLGGENLAMIKYRLKSQGIDLDRDCVFTLAGLQTVLEKLLGTGSARLLIREIDAEMKILSLNQHI